jgi:hypothetical protein
VEFEHEETMVFGPSDHDLCRATYQQLQTGHLESHEIQSSHHIRVLGVLKKEAIGSQVSLVDLAE